MTLIAPLLALTARAEAHVAARIASMTRRRRERASLRAFAAMSDDRLHDLGLTREGLRCGLAAPSEPLRAALACRTHAPLPPRTPGRMAPLRDSARWGAQRVTHLGW